MTEKKPTDSRRKLLKSIAAGSGAVVAGKSLPESWSKPVINSVMLPAHAATTETDSAPATTQACCIVAETYCGLYGPGAALSPIEIAVATDGEITITIYPDGREVLTDSISCTGGSFEATIGGITVIGEVGCGATEIIGAVSFLDTVDPYRATITGCNEQGSDIRLKTNIEALSTSRNGFNLYKFQYLADEHKNTYVGIMAQDVIDQHPEAIVKNEAGYYMVRYHELGLRMVTLEEWENKGPDSIELVN